MFAKKFRKISFFFCLILSFNLFAESVVFDDFKILNSVKNLDLGGHTAVIEESGVVLEKCSNGEIVISETVGPGLVTLKNCHDISVVLESSACLLLDSKTEVENLYIKSNGLVNSMEVFQAEMKNKKISQKKLPLIKNVVVEAGVKPGLKNIAFENLSETDDSEMISKPAKLKITQDISYKGYGVRFILENIPSESDALHVSVNQNGENKEISWLSGIENRDRLFSGFYEYEFLEPGREYEFVFWFTYKTETLAKYYIKAVPEKGINVNFDKKSAQILIDENSGLIKWNSYPEISLPETAELVYQIISLDKNYNWHSVGHYSTKYDDFGSFNLYENGVWNKPENIIDHKVFLHIFFQYGHDRWPVIVETRQFSVKR